jgi:hypothetical protein
MPAVKNRSPAIGPSPPPAPAESGPQDWTSAFFPPCHNDAAVAAAEALAQLTERILRLAQALTQTGRSIELSGLEHWVGRLTACALDLDPIDGRRLRPALIGLLDGLDRLEHAVTNRAPPERRD